MTLTPNTQITQENVGLLKAGDWIDHPEWGLAQYQPLSGDDNSLTGPWTYIGPDLGDGWIGWGGEENPVPGLRAMIRTASCDDYLPWASEDAPWGNIIAFRPALPPPAEAPFAAEDACLACNSTTPSPVDWNVVGPKLVEALKAVRDLDEHPLHWGYDDGPGGGNYVYRDTIFTDEAFPIIDAALAAAQSEGK